MGGRSDDESLRKAFIHYTPYDSRAARVTRRVTHGRKYIPYHPEVLASSVFFNRLSPMGGAIRPAVTAPIGRT